MKWKHLERQSKLLIMSLLTLMTGSFVFLFEGLHFGTSRLTVQEEASSNLSREVLPFDSPQFRDQMLREENLFLLNNVSLSPSLLIQPPLRSDSVQSTFSVPNTIYFLNKDVALENTEETSNDYLFSVLKEIKTEGAQAAVDFLMDLSPSNHLTEEQLYFFTSEKADYERNPLNRARFYVDSEIVREERCIIKSLQKMSPFCFWTSLFFFATSMGVALPRGEASEAFSDSQKLWRSFLEQITQVCIILLNRQSIKNLYYNQEENYISSPFSLSSILSTHLLF